MTPFKKRNESQYGLIYMLIGETIKNAGRGMVPNLWKIDKRKGVNMVDKNGWGWYHVFRIA